MTTFTPATFAERSALAETADRLQSEAWPEFMLHDLVANRLWWRLGEDFPDYQFMLLGDGDEIVSVGFSIPMVWDGNPDSLPPEGWGWGIQRGVEAFERGETPNTLCAMAITIPAEKRGGGISQQSVSAMRDIAARHGFANLIAPVRPNLKPRYPLTPIERYIQWTTDEGAPFDAWLRVHWRLGATIIKPCRQSMVIEGTVAKWESWTEMRFPETGTYIVPGALEPVAIDCEANLGRYVEPNVWMQHRV
jgi:hypothetical protein